MKSMRQSFYPKHQVLVLKCYPNPKFLKNNAEVRPNSSELSYLLYYASSRRSKLQKVGDFLERKTATDIWRARIGNVQVTLQIFAALIEKCPRDLPLYAPAILRTLRHILRSNDITLLEYSIPTFETFCAHHSSATLAADQDYITLYEEVVRLYAGFASKDKPIKLKHPLSVPLAVRYRKAGLQAIKSIASSDSVTSDTGRQLRVIVPIILENIFSTDGNYLRTLRKRDTVNGEIEKDTNFRRRQSLSISRTTESVEADPMAASGSIEDADKLAEEEVGLVAMQSLRHVFTAVNRGQLRLATSLVLDFVTAHVHPEHGLSAAGSKVLLRDQWSTSLFEILCQWAPVQDRFIILITSVEVLVQSSVAKDGLEKHLVMTAIVDWLLRSKINFIGLSVMDVLVGLLQDIYRLLQFNGAAANGDQQPGSSAVGQNESRAGPGQSAPGVSMHDPAMEAMAKDHSELRKQLVAQLQRCIGGLATHTYYTDQVSDMVHTVLQSLKPFSTFHHQAGASAIQKPMNALEAPVSSPKLPNGTVLDESVSPDAARIRALSAVKDILTVANSQALSGSSASVSRNKVAAAAWEGTEWLFRDPNKEVRVAYIDALLTWLRLEVKPEDMLVPTTRTTRATPSKDAPDPQKGQILARRAVSGASQREASPKRTESGFLQLLHLAVYENANQYAESEHEILLLHLLLVKVVERHGINGVRHGLPMIMRLQEDIQSVESPTAKVNLGSLVHGYLWALSVAFEFEPSTIGREIQAEIGRRRDRGMWTNAIKVPPLSLEQLGLFAGPHSVSGLSPQTVQTEVLKPFDDREKLVDMLAEAYEQSLIPPPSSPPRSPNRSMSIPVLSHSTTMPPPPRPRPQLPSKVKKELLSDWNRDACIATATKESSRSVSLNGSRGAAGLSRTYLAVNIPAAAMSDSFIADGSDSPMRAYSPIQRGRSSHAAGPHYAGGRNGSIPSQGRTSVLESPSRISSSSRRSVVKVEDLKRVLSGGAMSYALRTGRYEPERDNDDTASESMMSATFSASEVSFANGGSSVHTSTAAAHEHRYQEEAATPRPNSRHTGADDAHDAGLEYDRPATGVRESIDSIPPVPPIPAVLQVIPATPGEDELRPATITQILGNSEPQGGTSGVRKAPSFKRERHTASSQGESWRKHGDDAADGARPGTGRPDFRQLLDAIDVDGDESTGTATGGIRPPY